MKKLISIVLCVVLAICLIVSANAAENSSLSIEAVDVSAASTELTIRVQLADPVTDGVFYPTLRAPVFHKARVSQRFLAADAVFIVRSDNVRAIGIEQVQQTHRVRTAGHRAQYALTGKSGHVKLNSHLRGAFLSS